MSIFGRNIKKIRILKNMNQQEFGELFEISRGSIGSYEEGRAEPKIDSVIKIAKKFDLSIDHILTKELTVNELSNFANKISKHEEIIENIEASQPEMSQKKVYLEDRVSELEKKIEHLEQLIKNKEV